MFLFYTPWKHQKTFALLICAQTIIYWFCSFILGRKLFGLYLFFSLSVKRFFPWNFSNIFTKADLLSAWKALPLKLRTRALYLPKFYLDQHAEVEYAVQTVEEHLTGFGKREKARRNSGRKTVSKTSAKVTEKRLRWSPF